MSSIVQKAAGVVNANGGTFSFPKPTTAGNAIVVIIMLTSTATQGLERMSDDSGANVYDFTNNKFFIGFNAFNGNNTLIYGIPGQSGPSDGTETLHCAPMQSFTFTGWLSPPLYVWAYEIAYGASTDAGPPAVFWTGDGVPAPLTSVDNTNATQVVPQTNRVSGDGGDVAPKVNLYFAAIAPYSSPPVSVTDNLNTGTIWTLDTIQNGWSVGYAEDTGSSDQQAAFTVGSACPYGALWLVIADVGSAPLPSITIRKTTDPPGSSQGFNFTPSWGAPFTLHDGQQNNSGPLLPGTYSVVETPVPGWLTSTSSDPSNIVISPGNSATVTFTNTLPPECTELDVNGNPVDGVFIPDLSLFIIPATALYKTLIPHGNLTASETALQGRREIILDFNGSDGLWMRDLGTIFTWPVDVRTVLDIWQPSVLPEDSETLNRLTFHWIMQALGLVGWGHIRELNIPHISTADLTLTLEFDQWPNIVVTIPNSGGKRVKTKVTVPVNKFKLAEGVLSSAAPFKFFNDDMEVKLGQWGRSEGYAVIKPMAS